MKKKIKLFLSSVVFICGIFTSCENLLSVKEEKQTEQSYIRISTNLSSVDRSVLPSDSFKENTTGLTWTLSGSRNGTTEITIKVWNDENGDTASITQTAYQKMINDFFIPVDEGTWIFTLTAKNNSGKVLEATKEKTINGGQNTLVFDMKEAVGEGAASGQIEFTLKWKELGVVGNVAITLSKRNDSSFNNIEVNYETSTSIDKDYEYVNFSAGTDYSPLEAGSYMLKMELRQQTGFSDSTESTSGAPIYKTINTYTCLIHVAPGLCSKGDAELETLAPLYKVIFDGIEGIEFEESIVSLSYNAYTTFALPTIKEDGYEYEYQWHKTGRDSATGAYIDELIKDPLKVCINENAHTFVLYRYKIVAENDIVRTAKGVSTGDSFSIDTAEGLGIFRDLVNGCNENLKMVDNSGESEEVFVYYETGLVNYKTQLNAKLTSDIDLTDGNELSWVPINGYSGTFDGGGHTITVNNTYQVNGNLSYQGFFDTLDGATIKNLVVAGEETISESGLEYCGGIASQIENARGVDTTFENCVNKRNITVSADVKGIGGFVGYTSSNNSETTNFVNCINLGTIKSEYSGIDYSFFSAAGFTKGATSYEKCINAGNVLGSSVTPDGTLHYSTVAGFDANASASFTDCINLGDISANSYTTDDGVTYSTEKVYGFSSIESDNFPSFENCIDAGSAKNKMGIGYPFTGVVDNTTGTYVTSYYNSDSYDPSYKPDYAKTSDELCIQEKINFSNWSYDSSRYPLPNIEENFSSEIWQEVVAKAIPKVSNFEMLKNRITSASGTAYNPEVIVLNGNIDIAETLEITTPIKIIASTSEGVTITRGLDGSGSASAFTGAFFDNQSTLTLEGITLNGGKTSSIEATAPLITSSGNLTLNNCTLQNNKNTSNTPGGAINISAGTFTMNGGVIGKVISEDVESKKSWEYAAKADNYSNYAEAGGGGIYVASGDVTIDNATISYNYTPNPATNFENNTPSGTAHGGGISIVSGSLSLKGSEVSYNSGYQGGGIRCYQNSNNSSGNILTLEKSKIIGNISNPYYCNGFGGGVMVKNFTVKFEGDTPSVIEENYSGDGGALFLENTNSILQNTPSTLQNITIQNNFYNENGYKNGSEVLLYSGANVSIGSSDVTIKSADGETRGIFMNNNNTLNLSGDAKLDTPIYLTNKAMVTVSAALTSNESIVATITPEQYNEGTQVVNASEGVNIERRFAVTPKINEDGTTTTYTIDSAGKLVKASSTDPATGGTDGYEVGQDYYDDTGTLEGYIFEIGTNYIKIASPKTMTSDGNASLQWCSSGVDESLFSITDGIEMKETIAKLNNFGTYSLFYELKDSEWYVPTQTEFELMLLNLPDNIIDFESSTFWTCTLDESQGNFAFCYSYGEWNSQPVTEYSNCIPVRKITF